MPRHAGGRARDPRRTRPLALAGVVVTCAVVLPWAVASAGSVREERDAGVRTFAPGPVRPTPRGDGKAPPSSPLPLGAGLSTAVRCGPDLASPDGIEAQTCVLVQGTRTWARTYYRNATGRALGAVLSFMGPGGRTVQIHCPVGAGDEPGTCETPREPSRGDLAAYTAVAEFADRIGRGPLLLRSGSNSPEETGS
ncbi:hypothetical protein ACIF8T_06255 [Streptomyces sp. NPDC085946]|uniref:hypothetical protein n=1 Tax=Streptomyces sp. NPDC085946 TaxID=3365744 RepID=UPI0037CDBD9E